MGIRRPPSPAWLPLLALLGASGAAAARAGGVCGSEPAATTRPSAACCPATRPSTRASTSRWPAPTPRSAASCSNSWSFAGRSSSKTSRGTLRPGDVGGDDRPERSAAGRFSVPVVETGAVVLLREPERFSTLDALDRPVVRIGVNAGGYLERVARAHFRAPRWSPSPTTPRCSTRCSAQRRRRRDRHARGSPVAKPRPGAGAAGAVHPRPQGLPGARGPPGPRGGSRRLAAGARADGSLARLRRRYLGEKAPAPTATPLAALVAAVDERLALMPGRGGEAARRAPGRGPGARPTSSRPRWPACERRPSEATPPLRRRGRARRSSARRSRRPKQVQWPPGETPPTGRRSRFPTSTPSCGRRCSASASASPRCSWRCPGSMRPRCSGRPTTGCDRPGLENTRRALADAVTALSKQPRLAGEEPARASVTQ